MNLVFVRHGQSNWNKKNKFTGWVDVGLSQRGNMEAIEAGKLLSSIEFIPKTCYTSFLTRSKETANHILNEIFNDEDSTYTKKELWQLNERHYGALQGLDKLQTANEFGEDQVHLWRRGYKTQPPLVKKDSKYDPNIDPAYKEIHEKLPLGESLHDVVSRVEKTLEEIKQTTKDGKVLVVAHGNSIRAMVKILEAISDEDIVDINIPTGIPLAFNINDDKITRIGYLGNEKKIQELEEEVKLQSRLKE
ncbi:MAG: 2,3-bisphosphoglycerate-dependent phosphoglycerate mutase [Candidatus Actinomarinaceae bacterium]